MLHNQGGFLLDDCRNLYDIWFISPHAHAVPNCSSTENYHNDMLQRMRICLCRDDFQSLGLHFMDVARRLQAT
jgi:hypothetical protein